MMADSRGGCQIGERDEAMHFFGKQSDGEMYTGPMYGDDAGVQAVIPTAAFFADSGGTTEPFPHSARASPGPARGQSP